MPQQRYASGKYAVGTCDVCGWKYPLLDLKPTTLSAYGAPSNAPSGLMACPPCWDAPHPQSFLPIAVAAHGSDPEQVRNARPDIFPIAYPVRWAFPNAVYSNGPIIELQQGQTYVLFGSGVFAGYSATIAALAGVTVNSSELQSTRRMIANVSIDPAMPIGAYLLGVIDQNGNQTNGQIQIIA